jgi:uncharacterized protein involved in type VI secretion and phage assembly
VKQIGALPQVSVEIGGTPLSEQASAALTGVLVLGELSAPTVCELQFSDPPGPLETLDALSTGAMLRVRVSANTEALFDGQVTAVEHRYEADHGHQLRIRAYDLMHRLRKRQRVRAHLNVTPGDLARDLVADTGVSVNSAAGGPKWERLIQHRQSDLELLVDTCARSGLYFALWGTDLHLLTLDGIGDPVELTLGDNLIEARVEVNGDLASSAVSAAGWHPLAGEPGHGAATSPRLGRRVEVSVSAGELGGLDSRTLVDEAISNGAQADALAQSELDRRALSEVTFHGVADGDPRLRAGARIKVSGLASKFTGTYVVTEVKHRIDEAGGFTSEISTAAREPRPRPRAAITTPAVVTHVNDPDGLGRVKVSLPTYGDVETGWMGVLGLGAGRGKGLVMLPDVGDEVLLLLAHEDPEQGIVLGGLYGPGGPVDPGVVNGATRRYTLVTSAGHRVRLDDEKKVLRIEDPTGSYVEMTPNKVTVHAKVDLDITAPGHRVVISAQAIDFESA